VLREDPVTASELDPDVLSLATNEIPAHPLNGPEKRHLESGIYDDDRPAPRG